jgi:hypothetical protein
MWSATCSTQRNVFEREVGQMDSQLSGASPKGGRPQSIPAELFDTVLTWHRAGLGYISIAHRLNNDYFVFTSSSSVRRLVKAVAPYRRNESRHFVARMTDGNQDVS